ncbi:M28 family peptidase [Neobacillus bataviensis]|uniref:M28 family peptidase n=1 Tax=Neobacillus bataviensis TaxID=220685 RepID=UPI001CBD460C|nr:M28 family peptidase [Neobacillus bataviensis]
MNTQSTKYSKLLDLIDKNLLYQHVKTLSQWARLTGEEGAEKAVDYIVETLQRHHIQHNRNQFDGYFSDPVDGQVSVIAPNHLDIRAKTRSFGYHLPQGIKGNVIYDCDSEKNRSVSGPADRFENMKDKIVVSWNYYEDYVKKIESAGAIGLIHIWPSKEEAIHEETVGTVWGTPTIENIDQLTKIPVVGINYYDGMKLLELTRKDSVMVVLKTEVKNGIKRVSLPVADIPGEMDEYILISGHYDSWHKGATDNATANALMLELARIFSNKPRKRGIKIAWWPGHSNGRYAGSAWYCDQFWQEINERCVAHINIDFPGTKGNVHVVPRSTSLENAQFLKDIIAAYTEKEPSRFDYLPRGADQSFWGTNIPIHLMLKYEPIEKEKIYQTPGGNWWWHTEDDLLDKVDFDLLFRDTGIHLGLVDKLANVNILPINLIDFISDSRKIMNELDKSSDEAFDFTIVYQAFEELTEVTRELSGKEVLDVDRYNKLLKKIGGTLNRLKFSYSSKYGYDNTFPFQPYPGLAKVKDKNRSNTPPDEFLFTLTFFVRQRNRVVNEIKEIIKEMKRYLD